GHAVRAIVGISALCAASDTREESEAQGIAAEKDPGKGLLAKRDPSGSEEAVHHPAASRSSCGSRNLRESSDALEVRVSSMIALTEERELQYFSSGGTTSVKFWILVQDFCRVFQEAARVLAGQRTCGAPLLRGYKFVLRALEDRA